MCVERISLFINTATVGERAGSVCGNEARIVNQLGNAQR